MIRKLLFVTVATLMSVVTATAFDPNAKVLLFGMGTLSCATWLSSPEYEYEGDQWIFGYFTAANEFSDSAGQSELAGEDSGIVGHGTDQLGIIAEVKKTCASEPSELLTYASNIVYLKLRNGGN